MLKNRTKKLFSLILIIAMLIISSICYATDEPIMPISEDTGNVAETEEDQTNNEEEIDTSDWVNSDAYLFSEDIVVNKVVDGNVFAIGNTVTVTGEIGGDLFVLADKVIIDGGYIYSSIFAIANEIQINGVVYDLYAIADNITIGDQGFIYRDIRVTSDTLDINGKIRRDAYVSAREVNIASNKGTVIYGNFDYTSATEAFIPEGAIAGETTYTKEDITTTQSVQSTILSYIGELVKALIYALVVILLASWLAPKFTEKLSMTKGKNLAEAFGIGILALGTTALVSLILLFTVLGIPLACGLVVLLGLLISISKAVVAMTISGIVTKKFNIQGKMKYILIALLSVLVIWAICQIPFNIGFIFKVIIGIIGVGLVLTNIVAKKTKQVEEVKE